MPDWLIIVSKPLFAECGVLSRAEQRSEENCVLEARSRHNRGSLTLGTGS